ncbi:MAG: hypothetical protein C4576_10140 [Desulfobacteraceae bacterium]|nr:MAG: hypothetical protein C4576_10140 [Desulfobacteraceae bacterium]
MKRRESLLIAILNYWRVVRQCDSRTVFLKRPEPIQLITILDYWRVVRQYRWMIVGMVFVSVLATGVVSKFLITAVYETKAVVLPAREEPLGGGGMSFGGGDKEKGGSSGGRGAMIDMMGGRSGPSLMDTLNALLSSRTIGEAIAEDLNLMAYYGTNSLRNAVDALRSQVEFKFTKHKTIEITVQTGDPEIAVRIANAYAVHLDRLNKQFSMRATKRTREFIEQRLAEKSKQLITAEETLKEFQTKNRSLALDKQSEAAFETVTDLHGKIIALQVELAALRVYATPAHPMINQLEVQITQLRRELDRLEADQTRAFQSNKKRRAPISEQGFPTLEEAPSLALQYFRLVRQSKVEEAVYGMLVGTLEQVKISEARDLPTVELLDPAIPPLYKSKPNTLQNVVVAGVLSFAIGTLLAYFFNYLLLVQAQEAVVLNRSQVDPVRQLGELEPSDNGGVVPKYPLAPQETEAAHR